MMLPDVDSFLKKALNRKRKTGKRLACAELALYRCVIGMLMLK